MLRIDTHLVIRSLTGRDEECGDMGFIRMGPSHCLLALVDGLGHGPEAAEVARQAVHFLESHSTLAPAELLNGMHEDLKGSRGAVASVCQLNLETGLMTYAGMGNVTAKILGIHYASFVNGDGVIGYMMRRPRETTAELHPGEVFLMFSDGVSSNFPPVDLDHMLGDSADFIATEIMNRYGKKDDDASCLVARCLR